MTITSAVLVDYTRPSGFGQDLPACARSGDWIVGAMNTGNVLFRIHCPTDTITFTDPWQASTQNLFNAAVRPNGNVCFIRNSGWVHEVVPSTGSTTTWSAGGTVGGSFRRPATIGEHAYFGANRLNMSAQSLDAYSAATGSAQTVAVDGTVWALPTGASAASNVDTSTLSVTTMGSSPPAGPDVWQAYSYRSSIWWPNGSSHIVELDPAGPSLTNHSIASAAAGFVDVRSDDTAVGVRRTTGTANHAVQFTDPFVELDGPHGLASYVNGLHAAIVYDRHMYVIGSTSGVDIRIEKVTFDPLPSTGGWSVGFLKF